MGEMSNFRYGILLDKKDLELSHKLTIKEQWALFWLMTVPLKRASITLETGSDKSKCMLILMLKKS